MNKSPDKKSEGKNGSKSGSAKESTPSAGEGKGIGGTQINTEDSHRAKEGKRSARQVRDLG